MLAGLPLVGVGRFFWDSEFLFISRNTSTQNGSDAVRVIDSRSIGVGSDQSVKDDLEYPIMLYSGSRDGNDTKAD